MTVFQNEQPATIASATKPKLVFVIEPDESTRGVLRHLETENNIVLFPTKQEAIKYCLTAKPDLVISAGTLDDRSKGVDFLSSGEVLETGAKRILMSGSVKPADLPQDIAFLAKPFRAEQFLSAIKNALDGKGREPNQ